MNRVRFLAVAIAVVALLAAVPSLTTSFYTGLALNVLVFALLAMSFDLIAGYAGMISFGHAAFLGLGAYGLAYFEGQGHGSVDSIGLALLVVLGVALGFGLVVVRVTGLAFGMVTLALGGMLWGLAYRWVSISGGDNGRFIPNRPKIAGADFANQTTYYYVVLGVVVVAALLLRALVRSPFGLALRGIKDDEQRMRTLGYSVALYRYIAYVVAGVVGGMAGVLFGFYNFVVTPSTLDLPQNFNVVMAVVVGGLGTLWGALVGAIVVVFAQQWLSLYFSRWETVLGVVFVLTVLFARAGLVGTLQNLLQRRSRR